MNCQEKIMTFRKILIETGILIFNQIPANIPAVIFPIVFDFIGA